MIVLTFTGAICVNGIAGITFCTSNIAVALGASLTVGAAI